MKLFEQDVPQGHKHDTWACTWQTDRSGRPARQGIREHDSGDH